MKKNLNLFQTSLETVRAHHWRYYTDLYIGCSFDCQYCLYRGSGYYGARLKPRFKDTNNLLNELKNSTKGILDIGGVSDAYQPIEKDEKLMPSFLKHLIKLNQPTFILTKGLLIKRDIPILKEMAKQSLVEVCFSIVSLDEEFTKQIEPGVPSANERLEIASLLHSNGIPVSFHIAPLIPGYHNKHNLKELVSKMKEAGGTHIFSAILGARKGYWKSLTSILEYPNFSFSKEVFSRAYSIPSSNREVDVSDIVCKSSYLEKLMSELKAECEKIHIGLVSENIPHFTNITLEDGIYKWKLPTVYDMVEFIKSQEKPVSYNSFFDDYWGGYKPGGSLIKLIKELWRSKKLFQNTCLLPVEIDDRIDYVVGKEINEIIQSKTMIVRRKPTI